MCSRIFDDAGGVEVVGVETIGDVAVDEDVSWFAVADCGLGEPIHKISGLWPAARVLKN